jgi:hypothetical protein
LFKLKEMAAVRTGNETAARRRIRNAVMEAVASIQETNGAASNGVAPREPDIETIRLRAYEIFLARGATHGDDLADWLIAERELRGAQNL